jgi:anti-sigma factor RsiW
MRCDEVAALLPSLLDGVDDTNLAVERHVEQCLRCQAELARYRKLKRALEMLRTRYVEPAPGLLGETLAAVADVAERGAIRSMITARRLAYAGAIGGTAVATAATAALLIARSRRRSAVRLAS